MTAAGGQGGPPRPVLGLAVGITGHRALDAAGLVPLEILIGELLREIADAAHDVGRQHANLFHDTVPRLVMLSQLAAGADQLASRVALDHGYRLHAVLPFAHAEYGHDFAPGPERDSFDELFDQCESWWHLPNSRSDGATGYALAGEATVAQVDVLIAVWDGKASRGPGGTADVIDYAVRRGVPVIHIPTDPDIPPQVLWSGLDGLPPTMLHRDSVPQRALEPLAIARIVSNLLAPPSDPAEIKAIELYLGEHERKWRLRVEYPALLALAGVRKMNRSNFISAPYEATTRADWLPYREALVNAGINTGGALDSLEKSFSWSDRLADYYAQTYRSGSLFNFFAAAIAVTLAVLGLVLPAAKVWLLGGELVLIGAVVANTRVGNAREWHRCWLDYRFLAEQLRPMRSLKLLGAATPLMTVHPSANGWARWTDWYASAAWRAMGAPPSLKDQAALETVAEHIAAEEVDPQISYNHVNAHRMHHLDHRLHEIGNRLFIATVIAGLVIMAAIITHAEWLVPFKVPLGVLTAVLPTLGSAVFGMRGQGDFAGAARRSAETADALERSTLRLRERPIELPSAARATEDAAVTMLADLGAWRTSFSDKKLAIPA